VEARESGALPVWSESQLEERLVKLEFAKDFAVKSIPAALCILVKCRLEAIVSAVA